MSDWGFIRLAYGSTWFVVISYTLFGIMRLRRAEAGLARVAAREGGVE